MIPQRWIARSAMVLVLSAGVQADTLYLRDGSRVQGELISVRNGTVEFEERRGYGGGRTCGSIAMRSCASSSRPARAIGRRPATSS